jgi:hypothetical protein
LIGGAAMLGVIGMMMMQLKEKGPKMTKLEKTALAMLAALVEKCEAYETEMEAHKTVTKSLREHEADALKRLSDSEHTRKLLQADLEATRAERDAEKRLRLQIEELRIKRTTRGGLNARRENK